MFKYTKVWSKDYATALDPESAFFKNYHKKNIANGIQKDAIYVDKNSKKPYYKNS